MQLKIHKALQFLGDKQQAVDELVASEEPLQININGLPFTVAMRTPGDDIHLTRGLLYSERIIKDGSEIEHLEELYHPGENIPFAVTVRLTHFDEKEFLRTGISSSSCGMCGKKELKEARFHQGKIKTNFTIDIEKIKDLREQMIKHQNLFQKTGGCHAASFFNGEYQLQCLFEDVGRHNAVDKGVGFLLSNNLVSESKILFLSGRISFEILYKAYGIGIPVILAISAPSSMCIEFAEEYGICVIGFCRENKATVYSCIEKYNKIRKT